MRDPTATRQHTVYLVVSSEGTYENVYGSRVEAHARMKEIQGLAAYRGVSVRVIGQGVKLKKAFELLNGTPANFSWKFPTSPDGTSWGSYGDSLAEQWNGVEAEAYREDGECTEHNEPDGLGPYAAEYDDHCGDAP